MPVQPNKAVVGGNAFAHSSGIHQDGVLKATKTFEIMTPESWGSRKGRMNLTSRSGSHMVKSRLAALGYPESDFDIADFYKRFIGLADKKGSVYDDDLIALMGIEGRAGAWPTGSRSRISTCQADAARFPRQRRALRLTARRSREAATGDGAVDAATKAIDRITGYSVTIENYHLEAVTGGREAQGRVNGNGQDAPGRVYRHRHEHRHRGGVGAGIYGHCQ